MHHMTHSLLDPNQPASKRISALFHEYEEQKTAEAKFVKDLDRLEMALQASEYEQGVLLKHVSVESLLAELDPVRSTRLEEDAAVLRIIRHQDRASRSTELGARAVGVPRLSTQIAI